MSEKDPGNKEGFAVYVPVDINFGEREISMEFIGFGSDDESMQQAAIELSDGLGADSWSTEDIHRDGSRGKRQFFFSGATWNAPWQPTGHKSNWIEPANPIPKIN